MKKNIIKITNILFLLFILLHMQTTFSFAYDPTDLTGTNMPVNDTLKNVGNQVIGILQAIGIVVSVAVATILGIKYMLGSVDQKAEYKKSMMPYVIGSAIIFAASTISYIIMNAIQL